MNLQYKKASAKDIDFLLNLRMKTMTEHYASSGLPTTEESALQRVLYQFEKANIIFLNNEPIGLLKIDKNKDKIEVLQLQIDPNQQGKGLGKAVLTDIIEEAKTVKKPITLSVLKTNKAQNLYSSLSFKIIDENEHSYIMEFSN
ncbi:GNAT family N-acetyltransferase [Chryseobacterium limigenitum]|uniref:Acetyltransferase (GNAT) domain-containing protein n=1 Tax=Chryseobacterium limigenitum TaxID=1612149 RepID=A0A1K2IHX3_9FLAO|nr:GNAT family N-acetyltransferase [Chryseobacterium limigenitum]SFZ91999.1 Acetyltransferase (GNAT) domain-containing protein [Chryseobacterium limigenitum]